MLAFFGLSSASLLADIPVIPFPSIVFFSYSTVKPSFLKKFTVSCPPLYSFFEISLLLAI